MTSHMPLSVKPEWVLETLGRRPDQRFTAAELLVHGNQDPDVPDNAHAMGFACAKLAEAGKIKTSINDVSLPDEDYRPRYWKPAVVQVDAESGRRFKMTFQGRVWLDDEEVDRHG